MLRNHSHRRPGRRGQRAAALVMALVMAPVVAATVEPATASAHGPVAPVATRYRATVGSAPAGVATKVVDGYVRMWMQVPSGETVVVLDYRGAPYLRFTRTGVQVNRNSEMFYLNQTPVAAVPPADLTRGTRPAWSAVGSGHSYEWHDGRLQALAAVAVAPGRRYVGRWSIPLRVNGRPAAITGSLWHAPRPSLVWFWPIAVIVLCALAAWRVADDHLDAVIARLLGGTALVGTAVAGIGLEFHGRPGVPVFHLLVLAAILGFVGWGITRLLIRPPGWLGYFVIAGVAIWEGVNLVPALLDGYVLIGPSAAVARIAAVVCLGAGAGLLPFVLRLAGPRSENGEDGEVAEEPSLDDIMGPELPA